MPPILGLRTPLPTILALLLIVNAASARQDESKAAAPEPTPEQARFFESKVRPILVEHCASCHGEEEQKSELRVDSRAALLTGGVLGPAVDPESPADSMLLVAVGYEDEFLKMPPKGKLAREQVEALKQWVEMGAPWPGDSGAAPAAPARHGFEIKGSDRAHWSFQPIARPEPPVVAGSDGAENPIDAFILDRLGTDGLEPNPPASRRELIRRVTYDLTGLPPPPAEVAAFEADESPDAYERLVDRLLASPAYGERWGRHWLDLVRYAETNSYERDNPKPSAWRYRDYVVRSLNDDKPYDRFVREQLAGDELPDGGVDGLIATGYYRLGIWDDEPTDRLQSRYDGLDDIVATTGQVFLGLTVDCARCHDHKIDPIPQKDYYRLLSFFQNINHFRNGGPTDEVPYFATPEDRAAYDARVADLERRRDEAQADLRAIEDEVVARAEADPEVVLQPDLEDLRYRFYRDTWDKLPDFETLKPEDAGSMPKPYFDLGPRTRDEAFGFVFEGNLLVPQDTAYTFFLDSDDGARLYVDNAKVIDHDGIHDLGGEKSGQVTIHSGRVPIRLEYFQRDAGLGLKVSWSGPGFDRRPLTIPTRDRASVDIAALMRREGRKVLGEARFREYRELRQRAEELKREQVPVETILCITEAGPKAPETFVAMRGNPHVEGDHVEPAFLEVLGQPAPTIPTPAPDARTTGRRTVLADWIASTENPLAARVIANRVWQHHFGRGIVRSPNDFGMQGDRPTHPELLDWLASELVDGGWRLKPLHRLILTSKAYRMSSRPRPEALAKDPKNDAFWRFDMRRLTGEEIRDSILALGGTLNRQMFGPSVYPYIPPEVMAGQSQPGKGWLDSTPSDRARRSVYVHVKRSLLLPILAAFDLPETDRSSPTRFSTTQPTQALGMLNGEFLNTQAADLADRLEELAGPSLDGQVRLAFRLAVARDPNEAEVRRGVALIEALEADGMDRQAARRAFALLVLNLNEFLYLD